VEWLKWNLKNQNEKLYEENDDLIEGNKIKRNTEGLRAIFVESRPFISILKFNIA
jgi:hypothetical protein